MKMTVFVAGATGATGRVFVPLATNRGLDLVIHVRPKSKASSGLADDPRARFFDLDDAAALDAATRGCDAIVSFIGTMRKRFAAGDTYASSDIGTTRDLVESAKRSGVKRFLLLSSVGAGGSGAYLKAKGEAERIVRESGLAWTIFRPSFLVSPDGDRKPPPGTNAVFAGLGALPGLRGWTDDMKPIPIEQLCRAFLAVLASPRDGEILVGRDLWRL